MLVLSRQRDESIMIGDNVVVTVVDIRGDKVRLGIQAPSEIPVHRREVYEAIKRENRRAGEIEPADLQPLMQSANSVESLGRGSKRATLPRSSRAPRGHNDGEEILTNRG